MHWLEVVTPMVLTGKVDICQVECRSCFWFVKLVTTSSKVGVSVRAR